MGGGYYVLEHAKYYDAGFLGIYPHAIYDDTVNTDRTTIHETNYVDVTLNHIRNPGIPVVSNSAHMSVAASIDMSSSDSTRTYVGLGSVASFLYAMPGLWGAMIPSPLEGSGPLLIQEDGPASAEFKYQAGRVQTQRSDAGSATHYLSKFLFQFHNTTGVTPPAVEIHVLFHGFWWDKFGGCETTDYREIPLA
jgi:hypothetical protein